ncbi:MAG: sulfatase-like hydrolase/transferase [Deltaproteobacteria bacterium]|nr:sulfatase-like hydrolase/transferase [Deltaproteobacteria bacterium]MBW2397808.1 sulfatase-like hydrolase/transferase [Deltaproteobacteria bacterium]
MRSRRTMFDLLVCLSLFNMLLLRIWAQLLPAVVNPANLYYMEEAPHRIHYPLVLWSLVAAAALATAFAARARRSRRPWPRAVARGALVVLALAALNSLASQLPSETLGVLAGSKGRLAEALLGITAAATLVATLWLRPRWVYSAIEVFAIIGLPFLLMTVGQAIWTFAGHEPGRFAGGVLTSDPPAALLPSRQSGAPRVVWIVFDELDQRALFTARHPGLELPEFDRLRAESFVALNAFAPARETRRSMASMLLGRQVSWALPSGPSTLPCTIEGGGEEEAVDDCWTQFPNLFQRVRESGANAGVSGWYHPYCRLFADALTACTWAGLPYWNSPRVRDSFDQQWHEIVKPLPLASRWLRPGTRIRLAHRDAFERILAAALEMAPDPDLGFAMLHFPVPHHPDIYDPERESLSLTDRRSYFDNLALADRTLGEVRTVMEAAGLWDASIVIVSSDHWWRAIHRGDWGLTPEEELVFADERDRRIPFLLKLANQHETSVYPRAFNTLLVHDLILDLLAGGGSTPASVADWLDERRATAPVPYLSPARRPSVGRATRGIEVNRSSDSG